MVEDNKNPFCRDGGCYNCEVEVVEAVELVRSTAPHRTTPHPSRHPLVRTWYVVCPNSTSGGAMSSRAVIIAGCCSSPRGTWPTARSGPYFTGLGNMSLPLPPCAQSILALVENYMESRKDACWGREECIAPKKKAEARGLQLSSCIPMVSNCCSKSQETCLLAPFETPEGKIVDQKGRE